MTSKRSSPLPGTAALPVTRTLSNPFSWRVLDSLALSSPWVDTLYVIKKTLFIPPRNPINCPAPDPFCVPLKTELSGCTTQIRLSSPPGDKKYGPLIKMIRAITSIIRHYYFSDRFCLIRHQNVDYFQSQTVRCESETAQSLSETVFFWFFFLLKPFNRLMLG